MLPQPDIDLAYHFEAASFGLSMCPDARIQTAAQWIAEQFELERFYISIAVVDDQTMEQLNAERMGHAWPTDVISFVLDQSVGSVEGEVIASAETAARICSTAGWSADDELLLYIVHGMLHVAGLDDLEPDQQQEMRRMELACLLAVGVTHAEQVLMRFDQMGNGEVEQ